MKKLLLISMLLFSAVSFSQTKEDSTRISETERIVDKYGDKIISGFNEMVDRVTPLAEDGFRVVVRLQIAKGVSYMLVPFITIVLIIIAHKTYKIAKEDCPESFPDGKYGGFCVLFIILSLFGMFSSIPCTYRGLMHLLAPEWFAVKEIIGLF